MSEFESNVDEVIKETGEDQKKESEDRHSSEMHNI
jgi:hypothetical protein